MKQNKTSAIDIINSELSSNIEGLYELIKENDEKWKRGWEIYNNSMSIPRNYVTDRQYSGGATIWDLTFAGLLNPELEGEKRTGYFVTLQQAHKMGWTIKEKYRHTKADCKKIAEEINSLVIPLKEGEAREKAKAKRKELIKKYHETKVYYIVPFFNVKEKYIETDEKDEEGNIIYNVQQSVVTTYYEVFPIEAFNKSKTIKNRFEIKERPEGLTLELSDIVKEGINTLNKYCERENIKVNQKGTRAFYSLVSDDITLPKFDDFKTDKDLFETFAHESVHSTGSAKRLKRFDLTVGTNEEYSKEELVAESGAMMLSQYFGILDEKQFKNHISYLKGYLNHIKTTEQKNSLLKTMNDADRAVKFIVNQ